MRKLFRCIFLAGATVGIASVAAAGELTVQIANGRATVIAKDVPVRQILAEWARVGNTRVVNGEKVMGGPITLELINVPEKEALDVLLRSAAGYMAAPRPATVAGASQFDRVIILATSRPPATTVTAPPAPFNRPMFGQVPPQPPPDDDDGEPRDQGPVPPPGMQNPGMQPFPGPTPMPLNPNFPPNAQPNQAPMTAPRPGMLPQPQPQMPNPYAPPIGPGARPQPVPGRPPGGIEGGPGSDDR
jgi:hypothetical protein